MPTKGPQEPQEKSGIAARDAGTTDTVVSHSEESGIAARDWSTTDTVQARSGEVSREPSILNSEESGIAAREGGTTDTVKARSGEVSRAPSMSAGTATVSKAPTIASDAPTEVSREPTEKFDQSPEIPNIAIVVSDAGPQKPEPGLEAPEGTPRSATSLGSGTPRQRKRSIEIEDPEEVRREAAAEKIYQEYWAEINKNQKKKVEQDTSPQLHKNIAHEHLEDEVSGLLRLSSDNTSREEVKDAIKKYFKRNRTVSKLSREESLEKIGIQLDRSIIKTYKIINDRKTNINYFALYLGKKHEGKERKLGAGVFGRVKLAQNIDTGAPCAMKIIRARDNVSPKDEEKSFLKEANFEIKHFEGQGFAIVKKDGKFYKGYLPLKLLKGKLLAEQTQEEYQRLQRQRAQYIKLKRALKPEHINLREQDFITEFDEKIKVGILILEYLKKYYHDIDLIHRDLKDGNIMYDRETESIAIFDNGLAEELGGRSFIFGDREGSPAFMAPEIATVNKIAGEYIATQPVGGSFYSKKSDNYAFGIILNCLQVLENQKNPPEPKILEKIEQFVDSLVNKKAAPKTRPTVTEAINLLREIQRSRMSQSKTQKAAPKDVPAVAKAAAKDGTKSGISPDSSAPKVPKAENPQPKRTQQAQAKVPPKEIPKKPVKVRKVPKATKTHVPLEGDQQSVPDAGKAASSSQPTVTLAVGVRKLITQLTLLRRRVKQDELQMDQHTAGLKKALRAAASVTGANPLISRRALNGHHAFDDFFIDQEEADKKSVLESSATARGPQQGAASGPQPTEATMAADLRRVTVELTQLQKRVQQNEQQMVHQITGLKKALRAAASMTGASPLIQRKDLNGDHAFDNFGLERVAADKKSVREGAATARSPQQGAAAQPSVTTLAADLQRVTIQFNKLQKRVQQDEQDMVQHTKNVKEALRAAASITAAKPLIDRKDLKGDHAFDKFFVSRPKRAL